MFVCIDTNSIVVPLSKINPSNLIPHVGVPLPKITRQNYNLVFGSRCQQKKPPKLIPSVGVPLSKKDPLKLIPHVLVRCEKKHPKLKPSVGVPLSKKKFPLK